MRSQRIAVGVVLLVAASTVMAGCSGGSSGGKVALSNTPTPHHHHKTPNPKPSKSASPTPTPTVTVTASTAVTVTANPTTAAPVTQDLAVTAAVRKQLVKAGADTHQLPASDYTGLVPGESYYAYDPTTGTYWAGAGLVPSSKSQDAQISVQDDGSYLLFNKHGDGPWAGYNVGLAGIAGETCAIKPPKAVVAIWHWDKGSCRPPS